jgi:CheY-like chemotaxis protein
MNKGGEIIIIDDDSDDRDLLQMVFKELAYPNEITFMEDANKAYQYLNNANKHPFLIISDVNMPALSGIELRDKMQQVGEVRLRTVPFIFMTTATSENDIIIAYANSVQGFFSKPSKYEELREVIKTIIDYWTKCTETKFTHFGSYPIS